MSVNLGGMQSLSLLTGTMDYSQIVQQLYQADRAPGDALNQSIQTDQLKSNDWGNISNLAQALQNALVTLADPSNFTAATATVGGTDSSAITATTGAGASPGTYNIQVKSGQYYQAGSTNQIGGSVNNLTQFTNMQWGQPISSGYVTVTIGNVSKQINIGSSGANTIQDFISNINSAFSSQLGGDALSTPAAGTQISSLGQSGVSSTDTLMIDNTSGATITFGSAGDTSNLLQALGVSGQSISSGGSYPPSGTTPTPLGHIQLNSVLDSANFAVNPGLTSTASGEMLINNVKINYNTNTDSLQSVINQINGSAAGVTAAYNPLTDEMTLTSKTSQPITVQDATGNLGQELQLVNSGSINPTNITQPGSQWSYSLDGGNTWYNSASPQVSNAIPGVTFMIDSSVSNTTASSATLTVAQDSSQLTKNTNAFITAFNNLYSQLQKYTQKGGDLQGDAAMAQLAFKYMNDVLTNNLPNVPSAYASNTVMDVGISNGPIGSAPGTTNSLQVDTNQLTTALQNNPSEVQSLIQGMATNLNNDLTNLTGQFNNLTPISSLNANMVSTVQSEQNLYSSMITSLEKQQQTIYDQAQQQEQIMQQQFTQLQQFQSQMSMQNAEMQALMNSSSSLG